MTLREHIRLWWAGFDKLDTLTYKQGWNAKRFRKVYAVDYGAACLIFGMGVQPISRWAYERRDHQPWRTVNRLLNALEENHGANSGGLLWGTEPLPARSRYALISGWVVGIVGLVYIFGGLLWA